MVLNKNEPNCTSKKKPSELILLKGIGVMFKKLVLVKKCVRKQRVHRARGGGSNLAEPVGGGDVSPIR